MDPIKDKGDTNKGMANVVYNVMLSVLAGCSLKSIGIPALGLICDQGLPLWRWDHLHMESQFLPFRRLFW